MKGIAELERDRKAVLATRNVVNQSKQVVPESVQEQESHENAVQNVLQQHTVPEVQVSHDEINYTQLDETRLVTYIDEVSSKYKQDDEFLASIPTREDTEHRLNEICEELEIPGLYAKAVMRDILTSIYDYHVITPLMTMDGVTTIQICGDALIRYRKFGNWFNFEHRFRSIDDVVKFVDQKLKHTPYRWSPMEPSVDAILRDGSRLHVKSGTAGITISTETGKRVYPCPIITIRRFLHSFTLKELSEKGSMDERMVTYLSLLPQVGSSCVIAGGQEMGKTTTLNALTQFFPNDFMGAFIEEAAEMQPQCDNAIRMWNRADNGDKDNAITMEMNLVELLRMATDIGVIGEIRTPEVMYQFLNLSNIGMHFVAGTLHASSAKGAVQRMINLALSAKENPNERSLHMQIADGIGHIIVLQRWGAQVGIGEIAEIVGLNENHEVKLRTVFKHHLNTHVVDYYGVSDSFKELLERRNIECPESLKSQEETEVP